MPHHQVDGHAIYYELSGRGEKTLVLFNGITMSTVAWTFMLPVLEAHYRLLRLDFLGQGESSKPPQAFYPLETQADMALAVLDALEIETCYLVGLSYGGMVAQHFARRHQARIEKLLLAATLTWSDSVNAAMCDSWIAAHDAGGFDLGYQISIPWLFSSRFLAAQAAMLPELKRIASLADWPSVVRLLAGVKLHDARTWLDTLQRPTHIIVGTEDRLTPRYQAELLRERITGATLALLPGAGHVLHLEAPEAFCRAVTGFCPP
ncbi:MAG: alpha/beta fold hydrolase [Paludibacterium sp.]|uniref:alpha/beta fold hydrolase n=1 Tax=Paludibacterium sp. TaxID=1917523 RepID=UPI00260074E6|nr:alpha/beta hydrolase [Paludibacterium sp.]MBV8047955.1 alpha/beta fold hydrolase [Paludibacterium sp.]MBV8647232.1 alpha/beta fold hydrolase [Paludibacterium sp.]